MPRYMKRAKVFFGIILGFMMLWLVASAVGQATVSTACSEKSRGLDGVVWEDTLTGNSCADMHYTATGVWMVRIGSEVKFFDSLTGALELVRKHKYTPTDIGHLCHPTNDRAGEKVIQWMDNAFPAAQCASATYVPNFKAWQVIYPQEPGFIYYYEDAAMLEKIAAHRYIAPEIHLFFPPRNLTGPADEGRAPAGEGWQTPAGQERHFDYQTIR